ncbi:YhbY family RNA-binding protein [Kushneria phosphatilytica]|uniref:YhbY family RNA-binding protein n=1 Tax=Kushneria phosphatilytica TaxID=657387 RepID=A0A1S1NUN7_9GAMM|nr:YhbY family RNA-binding protein [Kushneria phosphatilytica]OHV11231.1 ribosome assembly protein YhbY [Kushneria phosphatilytica]QEL12195.1 YhbY family RNA-binding protein [Kushneria phosphatilytica]
MSLSAAQRKSLRSIGHQLHPIVQIAGNGLSEGVIGELERALNDHELVKISLAVEDRDERALAIASLAEQTRSEVVQSIGKTALLYRRNPRANPRLSNVARYSE